MNVSLPAGLRDWVQTRIDSGKYASVSDYVRDLIRRDQEATRHQLRVEDVRKSIEESRVRGKASPAAEVFDKLERRLKSLAD